MTLVLIIKAIIVVLFLALFLRRPKVTWGVGLLAVTSAVLLDTLLGTFGREETLAELGFFFYIIAGILFSGGAIWAWGLLRLLTSPTSAGIGQLPLLTPVKQSDTDRTTVSSDPPSDETSSAIDRQMLYDEIRQRLGQQDILDLIFDLGVNENDVMTFDQDMNQLIIKLMDVAAQRGLQGELALAVERILTPIHPDQLPRLERISVDSPPTILRHFLLAHYDLVRLRQIADALEIDWEQLAIGSKKEKVRSLLLYLYRRNRLDELIALMHEETSLPVNDATVDR